MVALTRAYGEDAELYGEDDWALLRAHRIDRVPEYVPMAGQLVLQTTDGPLDLTPFKESVALPASLLYLSAVVGCGFRTIVSVENSTSFSEILKIRPESTFVLYTGGFASPAVTSLLAKIHRLAPHLQFFHWGDLDAGGLRILAHLRKSVPTTIRPLAMDVSTIEAHRKYAQELSEKDRSALIKLRERPELSDCVELIEYLLGCGCKLEQEALNAKEVVYPLLSRF